MRKFVVVGASFFVLASCGVFGASDDDGSPPPSGPAAPPEENAEPPLDGVPLDGVFLSSSHGFADGDGTPERPVKTFAAAFERARLVGKRVIACAEPYTGDVDLADGISAYGMYDCSQIPWKKTTDKRAAIHGVVRAMEIKAATRFDGFEVDAPDGASRDEGDPRASTSIGVFVRDSGSLTLANLVVLAGNGGDGVHASEPEANAESGATKGQDGTAQLPACTGQFCYLKTRQVGGLGGTSTCKVGPNGGPGGQGGDGTWFASGSPVNGGAEFQNTGRPLAASAVTAKGGAAPPADGVMTIVNNGLVGTAGPDGDDGKNGEWTFDRDGFIPGDGTPGANGAPGKGGGGGTGNKFYMCAGGPCSSGNEYSGAAAAPGGGAGGCGGVAGTSGLGGGASIGIFVFDSVITIESSRLIASTGGRGGKGSLGTAGLTGGQPGAAVSYAGKGGKGGDGGAAGLGGQGAPGPSIALVYHGPKPTISPDTALTPGQRAPEVPGLSKPVASGTKTLASIPGEAKPEHAF